MCGLVAMLSLDSDKVDMSTLERMRSVIEHRGPDDQGIYSADAVGFGFRRLSILDLSAAGHQPIMSPDGRYVLVFNGEIYNYLELRSELIACGHTFHSTGDTEVLLHAFMEWQHDCLEKLNGMWAFLIYDQKTRKLTGSRDRFGKKPLYYYRSNNCLLFASEIKSILASGLYKGGPNWSMASEFLLRNNLSDIGKSEETFYADIFQIENGTVFDVDPDGAIGQKRFWSIPELTDDVISDPAEAFYELFADSVRIRLRSDVPVAVFLSGGLDSTSVLCAVADIRAKQGVETNPILALSYHADEFDESAWVDETIGRTGAELIRFEGSPQSLWSKAERILSYQDEPVHSFAAVIYFELCRIASERGIKVILAGGGADEYLAGYFHYFLNHWYSMLRAGDVGRAWKEIDAFASIHGQQSRNLFARTLRSVATSELKRIPALRAMADKRHRAEIRENAWFSPELMQRMSAGQTSPHGQSLDEALRYSVESAPLPLYLREDDRSSMAHSIEARSPFLDHRLFSMAFRLPAEWKLRGPWNKYVLRESMRNRIPESVRNRPDKMGFSVPGRKWFADVLYQPIRELINSPSFLDRGIYQKDAISRDLELHREGKIDCASRLFNLWQFEIWAKNL